MFKPLSFLDLIKFKKEGRKITALTAYDCSTARYLDQEEIDIILVGYSLAMVALGYDTTHQVTMEEMLVFSKAVSRGVKRALVVGDMPFGSYQSDKKTAIENACRFIKEGVARAGMIEGEGEYIFDLTKSLVENGVPVLSHIGFTPQYLYTLGGYNIQGKTYEQTQKMIEQAVALEDAGAFGVVLEMVPEESAQKITPEINIPTIGIGSGRFCSGQILVCDDVFGKYDSFKPKFARKYADMAGLIRTCARQYKEDVLSGKVPSEEEIFKMNEQEVQKLRDVSIKVY